MVRRFKGLPRGPLSGLSSGEPPGLLAPGGVRKCALEEVVWVGVDGGDRLDLKLVTVKGMLLARIALKSGGKGFPEPTNGPPAGELFAEEEFCVESEDDELLGYNGFISSRFYINLDKKSI